MWRRAAVAWVAVGACGCSFEALDIRLRDAAVELAPADAALHDAAGDAPAPDAAPVVQRSCTPPIAGCGRARIEGGTFSMGDMMAYDHQGPDDRAVPVQPSITVSTFMLDQYEVTVARFRRFAMDTGLTTGAGFLERRAGDHCNWTATVGMPDDREGHPMNCVDWPTALAFCRWDVVDGTLPSEAQWEYAARGAMNRYWPWGGAAGDMLDSRVCRNRSDGTCLVDNATYAPGATPEGVRHLVGNVWEWTADLYARYDSSCWGGMPRTDPACASNTSGSRSIRGGPWYFTGGFYERSGARYDFPPDARDIGVGFRCASPAR